MNWASRWISALKREEWHNTMLQRTVFIFVDNEFLNISNKNWKLYWNRSWCVSVTCPATCLTGCHGAHSSHHCPRATQWVVIKYATYASLIHFLHNFEAQLNAFFFSVRGCIVSSMASLQGQKGLVWGRAEAVMGGEKRPMKTLCLTSPNTSNTALSFPAIN